VSVVVAEFKEEYDETAAGDAAVGGARRLNCHQCSDGSRVCRPGCANVRGPCVSRAALLRQRAVDAERLFDRLVAARSPQDVAPVGARMSVMVTLSSPVPWKAEPESVHEQRIVVNGVSWKQYIGIRGLLDDHPGLRMTYLEGMLEIMSPSPEHERAKTMIGRLIETYAVEKRLSLNGYGSTTFKKEARERGAEPDECYVLGPLKEVPDIAIEVVLTSGGIDKLAVYAGLAVPEVWFFEKGCFSLFRFTGDGYAAIPRSTFLPDLDLAQLTTFIDREDQTEAVIAYREAIRVCE